MNRMAGARPSTAVGEPMNENPDSRGKDSFLDVLASGVHDTKNTLFDALSRIGAVRAALEAMPADAELLAVLGEASTAVEKSANRLAQVLSAYRLIRHEDPVVLLPTPLPDFAEYVALRARESCPGCIALELQPVPEAVWLMDRELVADSLVNAIANAARYARGKVVLGFAIADDWLHITVADDGPGFPDDILRGQAPNASAGLFIASRLAPLHQRNGRSGRLTLSNRQDSETSGAIFTLTLP